MAIGWKKDYFRYKDFFLNILGQYKAKPNFKKYLELVLSMVTIALFAIFAIRPTILTIIDLNKEISEKQTTLLKLNQKIKDLQSGNNTLQIQSEKLVLVEQAIPDRAMPEQLVTQFEELAKQDSVSIMNLTVTDAIILGDDTFLKKQVDEKNLPDNANQLPFAISVTGDYQNLHSFVSNLQSLRRPVQIDTFAINSSNVDNKKVLVLVVSGRVPFTI